MARKLKSLLFKNKILCLFHGFVFRWDLLPAVFFPSFRFRWPSAFSGLACFRFIALSAFSGSFWRSFRAVLKGFSLFNRLLNRSIWQLKSASLLFHCLNLFLKSSCLPFVDRYFWRCMKSFIALIAVGLDAARIAFSKSKIEKKVVSASAAAVIGVGLLCSPIESVQAQESPYYSCPEVIELILTGNEPSDLSSGFAPSFTLDFLGTGWNNFRWFYYDDGGGYFTILILPVSPSPGSDDWVLLQFYVGTDGWVDAWVNDGDGSYYEVDVTVR